jgi:hypothetical protein
MDRNRLHELAALLAASAILTLPGHASAGTDATIALAGNAFVTQSTPNATEIITDTGLANWTTASTVTSAYFRVTAAPNCSRICPTPVTISLNARLAGSTYSTIRASINGVPFTVRLEGTATKNYPIAVLLVPAGYVKIDLQGLSKDGGYFGDVSSLRVETSASLKYASDPSNYYWSRRGASVHLRYTVPQDTEYFYNEVTVPTGQDAIGSYYMANGFAEGYFGMQVNSPSERRFLFSVWDADGGAKTTLVSKGAGVIDNRFGGEGTGGQSYLAFNWIAGNTYKFVTRAHPDGAGNTDYSAWFFAPELGVWKYLATWKRPGTATYLTDVYSFIENFDDTRGYLERAANYGNQWARTANGTWVELTNAGFTGDDVVAGTQQRMDYAGGLRNNGFYLRIGGFFNNYVPINQSFTRAALGTTPALNLSALPLQ